MFQGFVPGTISAKTAITIPKFSAGKPAHSFKIYVRKFNFVVIIFDN